MKNTYKKPIDIFKAAKTTGDLIKAFRTNFGIKQDDMAHACKISQANFSAIEKNRREVGPRIALKLAAFMGLSPDVVLYPNGYEAEPEYKEVRERFVALVPMAAKARS
jgi:transcriptional regulator with XRE-family HTH domain